MAKQKPRQRSPGTSIAIWIDRWMLQISALLAVTIWVASDVFGFILSEGTKASIAALVAYAAVQSKRDQEWRKLEVESAEMAQLKEMTAQLEAAQPGSPEALKARQKLVSLALRAQEERRKEETP
jgi:hypothetical protein